MAEWLNQLVRSAGGRKFIIGLIAVFFLPLLGSYHLHQGQLPSDEWVELIKIVMWIVLGLFTANVAEKKFSFDEGGK